MNIPYVSQVGNGIYNDCGEACVAMIYEYYQDKPITISEVENILHRYGKLDTCGQIASMLTKLGVPSSYIAGISQGQLSDILTTKPIISLVSYADMPIRNKEDKRYTGGHFIVLTDMGTDVIIYNDPLFKGQGGKDLKMSYDEWRIASVGRQIIAPKESKKIKPIIEEDKMTNEQAEIIGKEIRRGVVRTALIQKGQTKAYKKKNSDAVFKDAEMTKAYGSWDGFLDDGHIADDIIEK